MECNVVRHITVSLVYGSGLSVLLCSQSMDWDIAVLSDPGKIGREPRPNV